MKWISLITGMLILASTTHAQQPSELPRAPELTNILEEANALP